MLILIAIILIVLSIFLFYGAYKSTINRKQQTKNNQSINFNDTFSSSNKNEIMFNISRLGLQALETIDIISNTNSLDTLSGRYSFLKKIMQDLEKASTLKRYETEIQSSIDSYKTTYYEKIITSEQLQLILKPKSFDLITYYSISIVNSFIKYYENQIDQINNLKREDAKERRMKKIEEVLEQTIEELYKNCRSSANYDTTLKQLQDFKANLHEPQNLKNLSTQENVISFENEKNLPVKRRDITKDSNGFILNPKQQFKLTLLNCGRYP